MPTSWPSRKPRWPRPPNARRWDAQTWTEYGLTLRQAGKFAEARAAYENAIKANPSYAPAHRNLGVLLDLLPR